MSSSSSPTPKAACASSGRWPSKPTRTGWRPTDTSTSTTCASTRSSRCAKRITSFMAALFQNLTHTTRQRLAAAMLGHNALRSTRGLGFWRTKSDIHRHNNGLPFSVGRASRRKSQPRPGAHVGASREAVNLGATTLSRVCAVCRRSTNQNARWPSENAMATSRTLYW